MAAFASPKHRQFLSYCAGWLLALSWSSAVASTAFICGLLIRVTTRIGQETPNIKAWQTYCLAVATNVVCLLFNTVGMRSLPFLELVGGVVFVMGFIVNVVVYAALAPKADAIAVFTTFIDGAGWGNVGITALTCQTATLSFVIGSDGAGHMAEETRDASLSVPRAIVWSYVITAVAAWGTLVLFCFCYTDAAQQAAAEIGYTCMGVNYVRDWHSCRSKGEYASSFSC